MPTLIKPYVSLVLFISKTISKETGVPERVQLQISDALSIIAAEDFPGNWSTLIPELTSKLSDTDYKTNNGILQTAHSIFKKWRSQFRTDELFAEILYVLGEFAPKYLTLFQITDKLMTENGNNPEAMSILSQSMILLIKIYYDLNCQDLPEFFEDNLPTFTQLFQKYLRYNNPILATDDEDEPGPLEKIKTGICDIIELYTQKYVEDFPQLSEFLPIIFELVITASQEPKHDTMVCKALSVLTSVVKVDSQASVFSSEDVIVKLALPNIAMRTSDEELYEDNPIEYIRRDLEGSDNDTRRRAAADFIRGVLERFEAQVTALISHYINLYLENYRSNPQQNWKDKNTAIFLLVAISARSTTSQFGVTKISPLVDVVDFFSKNILSDLQSDVNAGVPILKMDAIKYLYTFRNQLTKEQLMTVFPLLVKHLQSNDYVVHTYAAIAIERILVIRHGKEFLFTPEDIKPYTEVLLSELFRLIESGQSPEKLSENDYLMKTVFRVITTSRKDMVPYVNVIMGKLTNILAVVSKNPSNPKFNHFVFESIGALIKYICPVSNQATTEFENLLFGPFESIISQGVQEFIPYAFQLLAQLLEHHSGTDLPEMYAGLLNLMLNPGLWEQGNIPALVRLLEAYLSKGSNIILSNNRLEPILGIFQQKLVGSRQNDHFGMTLLNAVIKTVPIETLKNYLPALVNSILKRLQSKKKNGNIVFDKFTRSFTLWVCLFFSLDRLGSPDVLIQVFDSMQPGLFGQILSVFVLPDFNTMRDLIDYKICGIGVVRLLTKSDLMLQEPYATQLWPKVFTTLLRQLELPPAAADDTIDDLYQVDLDDETGYQNTFSKLNTAAPIRIDPTATLPPCRIYLVQQLVSLPAEKRQYVKQLLAVTEDVNQYLPKYFMDAGIALDQL
ncbi:Cse1-domain-containing protein [Halteromyces radiatus]|uniref:Cse1-domain-containing protein n=1 Tax=Halteromyces radiatus TaxID=101107 RepID=UPI0022204775|nr:Cse1-domain-containing protein [Halteromyces radiatus]KAI8097100.1 Cse1-domain-containing protein [Halteromyces radiatus]